MFVKRFLAVLFALVLASCAAAPPQIGQTRPQQVVDTSVSMSALMNAQFAKDSKAKQINWAKDSEDAVTQSSATGKPVMLFFFASWCKYCKKTLNEVFVDPDVVDAVNASVIPLKMDIESSEVAISAAKNNNIKTIPTFDFVLFDVVVTLNDKGEPETKVNAVMLGRVPGFQDKENMKTIVKLAFVKSQEIRKELKKK